MAVRRGVLEKKYIFEYDVGQFSFGTIQVLKDKDTQQLKNCKTVPKSLLKSTNNVLQRLTALVELQHPHICSITDVLEDSNSFYIISEHWQGGDVQDWMDRLDEGTWLQEQTCATYVRQAVLALTHSHLAKIYHRDLRPSNLMLTSKMPDATIKIGGFGLAAILDPDNSIVQRSPTPYTVPEVLRSSEPVRTGAADMWSVGAIANALLVGQAPNEDDAGPFSGWMARRMRGVGSADESWSERSSVSRDFVRRLLRSAPDRPTAAKALHHPWLRGLTPIGGANWLADNDIARERRHKTLCYTLATILLPVIVPYRDFEQLRMGFQQRDTDRDGLVPRNVSHRLLLDRCNFSEAVVPALDIVDVTQSDVVDLCSVACADLIVREFFAAGPTGAPLMPPFGATDLVPRMLKRFFEVFGDRNASGGGPPTVSTATIRSKLRTATARDVELHAQVRYDDLLSCLPEDRGIDLQMLTTQLSANAAQGTPLGSTGGDLSPIATKDPWASALSVVGLDVIGIFQTCAAGESKREDSPHSIRIF